MFEPIFILISMILIMFCLSSWTTPKNPNKFRVVVGLLLLPFAGSAQDTLYFDYWINTTGKDSLYAEKATIVIDSQFVEVRTPFEFFSRWIAATGRDNIGDKCYFFTGCDKIRICRNWEGEVTGAFLTNDGYTRYFGVDARLWDTRHGWSNRTNSNR